jgi:hypothetical protein
MIPLHNSFNGGLNPLSPRRGEGQGQGCSSERSTSTTLAP